MMVGGEESSLQVRRRILRSSKTSEIQQVNPKMDVVAPVLLKGAWYPLEQCGRLLSDAVALYRQKSYSTAVALAMIGREELGKYRMP
jgi:hypothetical protein